MMMMLGLLIEGLTLIYIHVYRHPANGLVIEGWYEVPPIQETAIAKLVLEFDNT